MAFVFYGQFRSIVKQNPLDSEPYIAWAALAGRLGLSERKTDPAQRSCLCACFWILGFDD